MKIAKTILIATLLLGAGNTAHANLSVNASFTNGSFASSDLSDWTTAGDTSYYYVTPGISYSNNMLSDQYHLEAGTGTASSSDVFNLSQSFTTTTGQPYTFSFYINEADTTDALQVLWNADTLLNISAFTTNGWQLYSFTGTAASAISSIQFNISDYSGYLGLADVNVVAAAQIPLSSTFYSFGLGLLSLLGFRIRTKR